MKKIKKLTEQDLSHDVHVIFFLMSFHQDRGVETLKLENFLRAVPNVTVVSPQSTKRRRGRIFIKTLIKVHDFFVGEVGIDSYVRTILIPSIKKNCPGPYRPVILDWEVKHQGEEYKVEPYRWSS